MNLDLNFIFAVVLVAVHGVVVVPDAQEALVVVVVVPDVQEELVLIPPAQEELAVVLVVAVAVERAT